MQQMTQATTRAVSFPNNLVIGLDRRVNHTQTMWSSPSQRRRKIGLLRVLPVVGMAALTERVRR